MEKQKYLFEVIKSKISVHQRLTDVIEDLLGVGLDSAYRRIRGETELTFSELLKICEKFDLSVDDFLSNKSKQGAFFYHTPVVNSDPESYINYMTLLLNRLNLDSKSANETELVFTAQEIPFYHFFKYPELAYFRLFAWNDVLNHRALSYSKFCDGLKKDKIHATYEQIHHIFLTTPSKEIWTKHTIYSTIRMLEYYFETDAFESKDVKLLLLDQLDSLMNTVHDYANKGHKGETPFELYCCSVDLENNFVLFRQGADLSCIVQLYAINRVLTKNEQLCAEIQKWIESLMFKSTLISGNTSFKDRHQFFHSAKIKIHNLINKVKAN